MIHFRSSNSGDGGDGAFHRVIFSPRPGTSKGAREIERQLIYGYYCPFCRNPVLFAFLTPEKISLRKYEESWVVNSSQHIRKIIPSDSSDRETAYYVDWAPVPGRTMGLERVRMKNHVLSEDVIGQRDAAHQPGTRCCPYVGVFSLRRDLLIRDTMLMGGVSARELARYNLPSWEQFEQIILQDTRHFFRYGIGPTPLIMVRSDWIDDQKGIPHWREALQPFKKPKPIVAGNEESGESESPDDVPSDLDPAENMPGEDDEDVDYGDEIEGQNGDGKESQDEDEQYEKEDDEEGEDEDYDEQDS